jgi:hypothetical protein
MGVVAGIGAAAAAASLANTGMQMSNSGGGGSSSQIPQVYQPGNPLPMDVNFQALTNQYLPYATTLPQQLIGGYQQYAGNIQNNPYATMAQQGATGAAAMGQPVANMQMGGAQSLYGMGNQIAQTAFDPQQQLYDRLANQTNQQANVANAQAGVQGPYAAGNINQAMGDFNLNWQNAQLQRMNQGLTGAGRAYAGASDLGGAGIGTLQSSQAIPYSTYLGQQGDYLNSLNSLSGGALNAFGVPQQAMQDMQSYLQLGQSASDIGRLNAGAAFNQQSQLGQNLGANINAFAGPLATLFNGGVPGATPMPGVPGGYTNIDPTTFNYGGGGSGVDYMAA